jgi:hypothetical protein
MNIGLDGPTTPSKDRERGFWESQLRLAADAIHRYESLDLPARWRLIGRLIGILIVTIGILVTLFLLLSDSR